MTLEIHKPELVQRVAAHIRAGQFHDTDDLIEKALDALEVQLGDAQLRTAIDAGRFDDRIALALADHKAGRTEPL